MKLPRTLWFAFLLCFIPTKISAQQSDLSAMDSISIETLLDIIEKNSMYRIYSEIDSSFHVIVGPDSPPPLQLLKNTLSGTSYTLSVYDNKLFILKGNELRTFSFLLMKESELPKIEKEDIYWQSEKEERSTSENKVYTIGNPYSKKNTSTIVLRGNVIHSKTGKPLPDVNLIIKNPFTATSTDMDGNYSITLPPGKSQLEISGFNIKKSNRQLMLYSDGRLDIELDEDSRLLDEVIVISKRIDNIRSIQLGVERLQISKIKNIPMVLGEADLLRAIQTLPGVKTVGEASTGFNVRGGATDQNLILLNDGTLYNPNHLFGFFSAFSSEMIKDAEIYKSSIPAQYGGRISSVLDITSKEANKENFNGSAGIGLVTSKLNLEIPLIKKTTSLLLGGRATYSDWILKQLPEKGDFNNGSAGFYDFGGTFSHKVNDKNSLNVYGYYSHDRFAFSPDKKHAYSNLNASAKWGKVFNNHLFGSFTVGYDHYDYENTETTNYIEAFKLSFGINQFFAKADFSQDMNRHKINYGFKTMLYDLNSGTYEPVGDSSLVRYDALQNDKALETAFYIGDQWEITSKFSINAGIRYSIFNALGPRKYYTYNPGMLPYVSTITDTINAGSGKIFKTYHGPEFRLSARYIINDNLSVKAGFNSMQQFIHKLSNTVIMSPTDTWKLSDANIKPQKGWQAAGGLYFDPPSNREWETSVEFYYKRMLDYLDYRGGAQILMNHHIETDVINTEGYAYGAELSLKKLTGKLNGWANYTYSRTFLRQNDEKIVNPVNSGEWYPTNYDKPHDFKLVGNYKFTQRYSLSVNVDYSTGRPTTVPAGKYYDANLNSIVIYYSDRNSYRIPDYFRTDVSFNIEPSHKLTLLTHSSISIGVYNVTGRKNVYSIYYVSDGGKIKGYQMSIFGMPVPFITYNIKF